jgi:hypothetical protein
VNFAWLAGGESKRLALEIVCSERREILALLKQERGSHVSTFFDYDGLPNNWPGVPEAKGKKAQEIARIVEAAMGMQVAAKMDSADDLNRFVPSGGTAFLGCQSHGE